MTKIHPGIAEIQAKTCGRRFPRRHSKFIRMATFASEKATATHFGLYLCHPWTDFSHFFKFLNPNSIFYKFYKAKLFAR
jgi:hypothetical protein